MPLPLIHTGTSSGDVKEGKKRAWPALDIKEQNKNPLLQSVI